jgi:hypothetical protein
LPLVSFHVPLRKQELPTGSELPHPFLWKILDVVATNDSHARVAALDSKIFQSLFNVSGFLASANEFLLHLLTRRVIVIEDFVGESVHCLLVFWVTITFRHKYKVLKNVTRENVT